MAEQGDIVIVFDLLDPQGRNPKDRACVVVSTPEQIVAGGLLDVVAIATVLPDPLHFDDVPLPWHAQRHPRTGLNKRNAAVCSWLVEVDVSRVARKIGHVPPNPMIRINLVLETLRAQGQP